MRSWPAGRVPALASGDHMTVVWAWPVKRAVFARLAKIAAGEMPPYPGSELLVATGESHPVEVSLFLPAEPDRVCIFGTPLSFSRREIGGESRQGHTPQSVAAIQDEVARIEVRIRVYEPGEDFDAVDRLLGDMCSAVATAVLAADFGERTRMSLVGGTQDPTAMFPAPEPSVVGNASLTFNAEVVTS